MDQGLSGIFPDPEHALSKIAFDLRSRYPDAHAEVFLSRKGNAKPETQRGNLTDVLVSLMHFCLKFPKVQIIYRPRHVYGIVCQARCSCNGQRSLCCPWCYLVEDRPNAMVLLTRLRGEDILVGGRKPPTTLAR